MPGRVNCFVPGCTNSWYNSKSYDTKLSFHRWPKNGSVSQKYKEILKVDVVDPTRAWVCGAHFKDGVRKFRAELPVWHIPPAKKSSRRPPKERGPVPKPRRKTENFKTYKEALLKRQVEKKENKISNLKQELEEKQKKIEALEEELSSVKSELTGKSEEVHLSSAKLYVSQKKIIKLEKEKNVLQNSLKEREFSQEKYKDNDKKMVFYTGLTYQQFFSLWQFLEPEVNLPQRRGIPRVTEFFIVLAKLRLALYNEDLGDRVGVSGQTISKIYEGWITFLHIIFDKICMWPSLEYIDQYMPQNFKPEYQLTRVILDCTEIKVQQASNCDLQSMNFSAYKNCATVKGLVGITPDGVGCFISDLMPGSVSDNEITQRSGILDMVEAGRGVMTDRGFTIQDICAQKGLYFYAPPMVQDEQMPVSDCIKTFDIAHLRVHVERFIGRMRGWHILNHVWPMNQYNLLNPTWKVIGFLANMNAPTGPKQVDTNS